MKANQEAEKIKIKNKLIQALNAIRLGQVFNPSARDNLLTVAELAEYKPPILHKKTLYKNKSNKHFIQKKEPQ